MFSIDLIQHNFLRNVVKVNKQLEFELKMLYDLDIEYAAFMGYTLRADRITQYTSECIMAGVGIQFKVNLCEETSLNSISRTVSSFD